MLEQQQPLQAHDFVQNYQTNWQFFDFHSNSGTQCIIFWEAWKLIIWNFYFLGGVSTDESQKDVNLPDNSEENLAAAEVVVAPTVENGQQINVNKDVVDNTYEIYIYNAKEPSTNKNASNSEAGPSGSNTQGYIDIRFTLIVG